MMRGKNGSRSGTEAKHHVTVVRDRLIPKRVRGDNLLALQVRKDLHVYSI